MDTTELLKRVRRIEIKTRGLSQQIFAGEYHSAFKGKGMAFSEVREYQYGDDTKNKCCQAESQNSTAKKHMPETGSTVITPPHAFLLNDYNS